MDVYMIRIINWKSFIIVENMNHYLDGLVGIQNDVLFLLNYFFLVSTGLWNACSIFTIGDIRDSDIMYWSYFNIYKTGRKSIVYNEMRIFLIKLTVLIGSDGSPFYRKFSVFFCSLFTFLFISLSFFFSLRNMKHVYLFFLNIEIFLCQF
jgi:hypothetical protein